MSILNTMFHSGTLTALPLLGFRQEQKLPLCGIPTVGIVRKVPLTPTQLSHKHHHHGGAVCPSYGVGSMDPLNLMQVTSLKGVG